MTVCARPGCGVEFDGPPHKQFCGRACQLVMYQTERRGGQRRVGRDGGKRWVINVAGDVHDRLEAAAEERDLSMTWLANKLLRAALDDLVPADEFRLTAPLKVTRSLDL